MRLRGDGVLVREDGGRHGIRGIWIRCSGIDGRDDGTVILVLEEILICDSVRLVERVLYRRVEGTEREFVDDVRKIKSCHVPSARNGSPRPHCMREFSYHDGQDVHRIPGTHGPWR